MPRILHVMHAYVPATVYGGIVTWAKDVCEMQAEAGLRVSVVCMASNGGNRPAPEMKPLNRWHVRLPNLRVKYYAEQVADRISLAMLSGLAADIAEADVVHVHGIFYAYFPVAVRAANRARKPVVVSVHGMLSDWQLEQRTLAKRVFLAAFVRPFGHFIRWHATCQQEADDIRTLLPQAQVRLVPNGVDIDAITKARPTTTSAELRATYLPDAPADGPVVVSMCRLHHKKGLDLLLAALQRLRQGGHDDLALLIAGADDGEGERLRELTARLNLNAVVRFIGQLDGIPKWRLLAGADVFAMPSHDENFGIVYAEALACGTPVLASVHTPWSVLESDCSGRWVPLQVEAIVEAVDDLLRREPEAATRRALITARRYDWSVIIPEILHLYGDHWVTPGSQARAEAVS